MRLTQVAISDYRSIFSDDRAAPLVFELASGMNAFVGTNNCGKSNVLRAIALALDPKYPFDAAIDNPGPRPFAYPAITLTLTADGARAIDRELLSAAKAFEASLGGKTHYADAGTVVLQVSFEPVESGVRRREVLLTPSRSAASPDAAADLLSHALERLRESVRFVLISSGESIRSVLDGNFREILHSVVRERLAEAFAEAEASRAGYLDGIQESLLGPLRERLVRDLGDLFPEIETAALVPDVPTIDRTMSNVTVDLTDLVSTPLSEKGTGVRGGVLVAMLSYLASNATRGMIFAVEEPEAFLHPAAQEDIRDHIEDIALRPDVTLLATTHSPYIITRSSEGRVFGLAKDREGRTRIGSIISGDGEHSAIVANLYRESTFEDLLQKATRLPESARAVVIVEGEGDQFCLELACKVVGRPDLLDGLLIRPAGSAIKTVLQAIVTRAAIAPKPVLVLLDNDEPGRDAAKTLIGGTFGFKSKKEVLTYADVFDVSCQNFPVEAEDLFDSSLWETFIGEHGKSIIKEMVKRPDGEFHYGFDREAKQELLGEHMDRHTKPRHVLRWIELILKLRDLAGLEEPAESAEQIIQKAGEQVGPAGPTVDGDALIVTRKLDYARYLESSVLLLDTSTEVPADVERIGFYVDAEIKAAMPQILQHYGSLRFSAATVDQLRATGNPHDLRVAQVIARSIEADDDLAGSTLQLLLLSPDDDEQTFRLDEPIKNTKEKLGRPLAWAIAPQQLSMDSLASGVSTTTELDELEAARAVDAAGSPTSGPKGTKSNLREMYYYELEAAAQDAWNDATELERIAAEAAHRVARRGRSRASEVLDNVRARIQDLRGANGGQGE